MKGSPAPTKRGPKKREREPGPEESDDDDDAETVVDDNERSATPTLQPNQPTSSLVHDKKKKSRSNSPMPPYNKHLSAAAVPTSPSSATENFVPEADSNSSSSEDQPLSNKNPTNTKCKVEMLKSGKLLIKTSPDGPPTSAPPLQPPSSKKPSPSTSEQQTATSASTPLKADPAPLSPATPASRPDQDIPVPTADAAPSQPCKAVVVIDKVEAEPINNNTNQKSKENENNNSISKVVTAAVVTTSADNILRKPVHHHQPSTRIWLPSKCKISDKVVITDVTVNLKTVTIRECKTEQGFFKERDLKNVTN